MVQLGNHLIDDANTEVPTGVSGTRNVSDPLGQGDPAHGVAR